MRKSIPKNIREILIDLSFECEEMAKCQYPWYEEFVDALDICIDVFKPCKVVYGSSDACYCGRCLNSVHTGDTFCPCCKADLVWEEPE